MLLTNDTTQFSYLRYTVVDGSKREVLCYAISCMLPHEVNGPNLAV